MENRPQKKPTQPFGWHSFSKDGRVEAHVERLSDDKRKQELGALDRFVELFNIEFPERQISDLKQGPERGHDAVAEVAGAQIEIQLTELTDRTYIQEDGHVDEEKFNCALVNLISKKIARYGSSDGPPVWLVVFNTGCFLAEYIEGGRLRVSPGLQSARDGLRAGQQVFAEIWFTNLQTRPVQVWP